MSTAEIHDGFLRVRDGGSTADFHLRWLRHNCDLDRHPITGERVIESAELPDSLAVDEAVIDDAVLRVRWRFDQRVSRYPLTWLRTHAYAVDRAEVSRPPSNLENIEIDGDGSLSRAVAHALAVVETRGAALIRRDARAPEDETEAWIGAFGSAGLDVVGTHFGRIEDLRTDNTTNQNTDQLGYTDAAIELHTDQPFLEDVPRYQVLQGVRPADEGGDTVLADARAAFLYLESLDRDAARRLTTTAVRFHRKQKAFEKELVSPIIVRDGKRFQVRSSYFTAAPYHVPFDEMESWYRAHDRFVRIVREPQNQYRFRLGAGDLVLYDNYRMLHGRTAFRGGRWVRGVYFNPLGDSQRNLIDDNERSG